MAYGMILNGLLICSLYHIQVWLFVLHVLCIHFSDYLSKYIIRIPKFSIINLNNLFKASNKAIVKRSSDLEQSDVPTSTVKPMAYKDNHKQSQQDVLDRALNPRCLECRRTGWTCGFASKWGLDWRNLANHTHTGS